MYQSRGNQSRRHHHPFFPSNHDITSLEIKTQYHDDVIFLLFNVIDVIKMIKMMCLNPSSRTFSSKHTSRAIDNLAENMNVANDEDDRRRPCRIILRPHFYANFIIGNCAVDIKFCLERFLTWRHQSIGLTYISHLDNSAPGHFTPRTFYLKLPFLP